MHKHTCVDCGEVIAEGDFNCGHDTDHDYEQCDDCVKKEIEKNQHS